uniref:Putative secreted protein n=1 Tax=Panstrongylus lignarius TaxID=156445 RepID=A0A224XS11_9HEMI
MFRQIIITIFVLSFPKSIKGSSKFQPIRIHQFHAKYQLLQSSCIPTSYHVSSSELYGWRDKSVRQFFTSYFPHPLLLIRSISIIFVP